MLARHGPAEACERLLWPCDVAHAVRLSGDTTGEASASRWCTQFHRARQDGAPGRARRSRFEGRQRCRGHASAPRRLGVAPVWGHGMRVPRTLEACASPRALEACASRGRSRRTERSRLLDHAQIGRKFAWSTLAGRARRTRRGRWPHGSIRGLRGRTAATYFGQAGDLGAKLTVRAAFDLG